MVDDKVGSCGGHSQSEAEAVGRRILRTRKAEGPEHFEHARVDVNNAAVSNARVWRGFEGAKRRDDLAARVARGSRPCATLIHSPGSLFLSSMQASISHLCS